MQNNVFCTVERIYLNYKYSLTMQFSESIMQTHFIHKRNLFNNEKTSLEEIRYRYSITNFFQLKTVRIDILFLHYRIS